MKLLVFQVIKIIDYSNMEIDRPSSLPNTSRTHTKARILLPRRSLRSGSDFRGTNDSSNKERQYNTSRNPEQSLDIFFNQHKRKSYLKDVVDNYFTPQPQKISLLSTNDFLCSSATFTRDDPSLTKSSTLFSNRRASNIRESKTKLSILKLSTFCQKNLVPIIEETEFIRRPQSQYRSPISNLSKDSMASSFIHSNKSIIQSGYYTEQLEFSCEHYKIMINKQGGRKINKSKIYSHDEDEMLEREIVIRKLGVNSSWILTDRERILQSPLSKNLREMCYNIIQDRKSQQTIYLIYPTPYYYSLFSNNNEELIDIVVALTTMVSTKQGEVANHQIHLNNIIKNAEKKYYLQDWGCASAKQHIYVQGRRLTKKYNPYCRDNGKWVLVPEYLSPELLKSIESNNYDHLWSQKGGVGACDIWSIGCLIFQLITLVPLWIPYQCYVKGKTIPQRGHFSTKLRSPESILLKQRNFKSVTLRYLKEQFKNRTDISINPTLLTLLPKMLQQQPMKRISAEQILSLLQ